MAKINDRGWESKQGPSGSKNAIFHILEKWWAYMFNGEPFHPTTPPSGIFKICEKNYKGDQENFEKISFIHPS
jgi:hypothetical protein